MHTHFLYITYFEGTIFFLLSLKNCQKRAFQKRVRPIKRALNKTCAQKASAQKAYAQLDKACAQKIYCELETIIECQLFDTNK